MIAGRRVYLDTNVMIYAIEGYPAFQQELHELFETIDHGELDAVTSELTLAEVLVKPFIDGSVVHRQAFEQAIQSAGSFRVFPITRPVLIEAARLRAATTLKLPDAIHVATARMTACEVFLTNDRSIQTPTGIEQIFLSSLIL